MTRLLDPLLREGLQRANPVVRDIVEITAPDSQVILRRADDQLLSNPPRLSETPAATTAADANGALILKPTSTEIANHYVTGSEYNIGAEDKSTQIAGLAWTIDPTYGRVVLRKFTAKIARATARDGFFQLQIFRPKLQRKFLTNPNGTYAGELGDFTFLELLGEMIVGVSGGAWVANVADVVFDLSLVRPEVGPGSIGADPLYSSMPIAQNPYLIFQINPIRPPSGSTYRWKTDTTTAITQAGVGTFQHVSIARTRSSLPWGAPVLQAWSECFKLEIETYPATSQEVYVLNMPTVPGATSTGRVVFERGIPQGASATLELSTAGSGGAWTAVKHGDPVATKQAQYHLRLTLNASGSLRQTPRVNAIGLDFRTAVDISAEATVEAIAHEIQLPYCQAGIGEGRVSIVRSGGRDYLDPPTQIATNYPLSKLEFDHYLGSSHPKITRDRWLLLERGAVTNREPGASSESLPVLSALKALKKKIPLRVETINTVHTVQAGTTTGQVNVSPNLQSSPAAGDYLGKGYYMRVRSSSQAGVSSGFIQTIDSNASASALSFTTALPGTLIAGDIIEVHSAQFIAPTVQWIDADPADVWLDLLTNYGAVPLERVGYGGSGQVSRSGMPPKVTDRAPGDATTQAKLKITLLLKGDEELDKLVDQVSFILGGATVCIAGQFVFRQIYALYNAADQVTVPTATAEIVFDERDYSQLQTPTGIEDRSAMCACDYGVNSTVDGKDEQATFTVEYVDADAVAWLAEQDVAGLGQRSIPREITRWLFNTADAGFFLATQLAKQLVRVASTGLRAWSWISVDAHPELHVGDAVWIVTDQYTDYDPTRKVQISGRWAYRVIVISVAAGGRRFRALVPGLGAGNQVRGGAGTLPEDPTAPTAAAPTANITRVKRSKTSEFLRFDFALGGAGPLEWQYLVDGVVVAAWAATASPQTVSVPVLNYQPRTVVLQARQGDGQITSTAPYHVNPNHESALGGTARRSDEDRSRAGYGGVPISGGYIDPLTKYDATGALPLLDTFLGRFTVNIKGPNGLWNGDVIERGGGRGYGGFTSDVGDMVNTARDSRSALLNNHFRYGTDGADGVVENVSKSFTHPSYLDASRRPTILRDTGLATDLPGTTIRTGFNRAAGVGAAGIGIEGRTRAGMGGLDVRSSLIHTIGVYDATGASPIIDPVTRQITTNLNDPNGRVLFGGRMRAKVKRTAVQSISNVTATDVLWDAEDYDASALHDTVTNNARIIVPAGGDVGVWHLSALIYFATNANGVRSVIIQKSTGDVLAEQRVQATSTVSEQTVINISGIDSAPAVGDYYKVIVYQSSGGNLNIDTISRFSAVHLA